MAIREIVTKENDLLRKKSRKVEDFNERLHILLDDMIETMRHANGVGLAAVQVGVLKRAIVIEIPKEDNEEETDLYEIINPAFLKKEGEQRGYEGCLSCPGETGITTRPNHVKIEAYDRFGKYFTLEGEGLLARALCHEIDHLDGVLYLDIAEDVEYDEDRYAKRNDR